MDCSLPVGVFDSGVGGLTVVKEIMGRLPGEHILYFGDTARVPYGSKSKETVTEYSRQIMRFLLSQGVKVVVVACNTASALAIDSMRRAGGGGGDEKREYRCDRDGGHYPQWNVQQIPLQA